MARLIPPPWCRRSLLTASASLLALLPDASAQVWEAAPTFPTGGAPRLFTAGVVHQGTLYALGGEPFTPPSQWSAVHALDATGTVWTATASLEDPIIHRGAGVDSLGRLVFFGGVNAIDPEGDTGKAFTYDPIEGQSGGVADRTAAAPSGLFAWATDDAGRIYSLGGGSGGAATPQDPNSAHVERYSASTNTWQVLPPMPAARADAAAVADDRGRVLVIGGFVESGGARTGDVLSFDTATGLWSSTAVPPLPVALSGHAAVLGSDERVYVLGGSDGVSALASTWVLDLDTNVWTAWPDMPVAREHFGAAVWTDDYLYVLGGDNAGGGTDLVHRLYTPPCPTFTGQPADAVRWTGQTAHFAGTVVGGQPFTYRWRKDGVELLDGPSAGGGFLTGTGTATLTVGPLGTADEGAYDLLVSNACGTTTSAPANLTVLVPPTIGPEWTVTNLHPAAALSSTAKAIDASVLTSVAGDAEYPSDHPLLSSASHATLWRIIGFGDRDLMPAESVISSISSAGSGVKAGMYYWPYWTQWGTAYNMHACIWTGPDAASYVDVQTSGWEFGSLSDTDGFRAVGNQRWDESSTNSDGFYWPNLPSTWAIELTPQTAWGSNATALDDEHQYGSVHLGFGTVHAAMWSGTAASFVDLNPAGASWSVVYAAGLGQQAGSAEYAGVKHPILWSGSPEGVVDLDGPHGGSLYDVDSGLQVGVADFGGVSSAALWRGSADSIVDLHAALDPRYGASAAYAVTVDQEGTVVVAGSAFDTLEGRNEAVVWRQNPALLIRNFSPTR